MWVPEVESHNADSIKIGEKSTKVIVQQNKEHKIHLKSANAKRSLSICPALEQRDKEEKIVGWIGIKQLE